MTTCSSSSAMNPDSSETSKDYGTSILSSDLFKSLIRSDKFNLRSIAFSDDDDDYDAIAWLVFFLQRFPLNGQKHDADWSQRTFSLSLCDQTLWSLFCPRPFSWWTIDLKYDQRFPKLNTLSWPSGTKSTLSDTAPPPGHSLSYLYGNGAFKCCKRDAF